MAKVRARAQAVSKASSAVLMMGPVSPSSEQTSSREIIALELLSLLERKKGEKTKCNNNYFWFKILESA